MNVTYLLGAGASAKAIPVVGKVVETAVSIKNIFENNIVDNNTDKRLVKFKEDCNYNKNDILIILSVLNRIISYSEKYVNVDTYAKILNLTNKKEEYFKLKYDYLIFFTLCQEIFGIDPRYETFLVSLLNSRLQIPSNINFISWNYDSQFEIAWNKINEISRNDTFDYLAEDRKVCLKNFCIYKLNGGSFIKRENEKNAVVPRLSSSLKYLSEVVGNDHGMVDSPERSCISYSWEIKDDKLPYNVLNNTEVLVVIGYSFPYFNSHIDSKIINGMNSLHTVYLQDINYDGVMESFAYLSSKDFSLIQRYNFVREAIKNPFPYLGGTLHLIKNTNEFFIPRELLSRSA